MEKALGEYRKASAEARAASFSAYTGDVGRMQTAMKDARATNTAWVDRAGNKAQQAHDEYVFADDMVNAGGDYIPADVGAEDINRDLDKHDAKKAAEAKKKDEEGRASGIITLVIQVKGCQNVQKLKN